jgi:hypothetical protein
MSDPAFTLDVDGTLIEDPTDRDIALAFERLDGGRDAGCQIVRLGRDAVHWISAAGHPAEGFDVVGQDADPLRDYCCTTTLPAKDVVPMFQAYLRGEAWRRDDLEWDVDELLDGRTQLRRLVVILAIGAGLLALAIALVRAVEHAVGVPPR